MRAKLADVELNIVSSERLRHSAETSDKPIENGQDISDHTKTLAPTLDLVGAVMGKDASQKLEKLKKYQRESTLVKYIHRNEYHEMFILDIGTNHEVQIRNGYEFNITLKQIKVSKAKSVELNVVNPVTKVASKKTKASVKPKTSNGVQQPQPKRVTPPFPGHVVGPFSKTNVTSVKPRYPGDLKPIMEDMVNAYKNKPSGAGRGGGIR